MRIINNKQTKSTQSIFLCKDVDPNHLGREIYADNVETPYSFYLIRKLNLARDYQNLAEGEAFFEAICESWDETDEFEELVVKKIYLYVETEIMFYSVLFGSFEPVSRTQKINLKEWIANVSIKKVDRPLVHSGAVATNNDELKAMMKQLMETSNEIFRLRKIINDLNDNMNVAKIETSSESNPVISRSIRTIHLKRAQPLLINEEETDNLVESKRLRETEEVVEIPSEVVEEMSSKIVEPEMDVARKKLKLELAKKQLPVLEDIQNKKMGHLDSDLKKDSEEVTLSDLNLQQQAENKEIPNEKESVNSSKKRTLVKKTIELEKINSLDYNRLVMKKGNTPKVKLANWSTFSQRLEDGKKVILPKKMSDFSRDEMEGLEDKIYLHFMNKRIRGTAKKSQTQKKSITRAELLAKIGQAEYLNYSWGQVLKQRKTDVLICGRLSSSNLVAALDEFLHEMREIAYSRSLFGQKVRCSADRLRRLEGYILMDQYMQKLSVAPVDFEEKKGYF